MPTAQGFSQVVDYLMSVIGNFPIDSEADVLERWPNHANPEILAKQVKIKGFALAIFSISVCL